MDIAALLAWVITAYSILSQAMIESMDELPKAA